MCGGHEMRRGRHYATFTLRSLGQYTAAMLGVVGAGFDPTVGACAYTSPQGWMLYTGSGSLYHADRVTSWEGQPRHNELKEGDVVVRPPRFHPCPFALLTLLRLAQGLLLDCDAATLTVWVNGERKGVMVRPGMTDTEGQEVGLLDPRPEGPLRWAVDLQNVSVAIAGPLPLPA